MSDHKLIIEQLEKALSLTSDVLMPNRIEGISSCIHAGEWGIAFEILCENLYEYESPISKPAYELLEEKSNVQIIYIMLEQLRSLY